MCQLSLTHPPTVHYCEEPGCIASIPWSAVGWPWSHPFSQLNKPQPCSLSLQDKGSSPTVSVASPHLPPVYQCHSCIRHPKWRQYPGGWGLAGMEQRGDSPCLPLAFRAMSCSHCPRCHCPFFCCLGQCPRAAPWPHEPQPISLHGVFTYTYFLN